MPETTDVVREPRFWKITVNPTECPAGAWDLFRSTGRAMLGLPGDEGEANYAVRTGRRGPRRYAAALRFLSPSTWHDSWFPMDLVS